MLNIGHVLIALNLVGDLNTFVFLNLCHHKSLGVTKLEKGVGMVLLNFSGYVNNFLMTILRNVKKKWPNSDMIITLTSLS